MRLDLANFPIKDVKFGKRTRYDNALLEIDKDELIALALEDKKIASAFLDVAFPGEQTRIVNIRDVVEPRLKVSGPGCIFPGVMGPAEAVGEGRTNRLSGVTVTTSAQYSPTIRSGSAAQVSGLVDMWGPGSQMTPFGSTVNIVLILKLIDSVTEVEAHAAIQLAEFRVAHRLAEATRDQTPQVVEVFQLADVDPSLPRVVYIFGTPTEWHHPRTELAYYGVPIRESLPTLIHPNELLDGALTSDARRGGATRLVTWQYLNHPVVFELFKEHGNRLNFLGIILHRTRFETELGKHASATCASQMAKLLGADGAIVTRFLTSGNNFIDSMLTLQACEGKGIKTILMTPEWGGVDGTELPLLYYAPGAKSMVSTGSLNSILRLPAPAKVLGCEDGQLVTYQPEDQPYSPWSELDFEPRYITGGIDWLGGMRYTRRPS